MMARGGSINPQKAEVVAEFLKEAFSGDNVYHTEEFDRVCEFYQVHEGNTGNIRHRVRVSREFLDDHTEDQIVQRLRDWQVREVIVQAGARSVLITNKGCRIETEGESR